MSPSSSPSSVDTETSLSSLSGTDSESDLPSSVASSASSDSEDDVLPPTPPLKTHGLTSARVSLVVPSPCSDVSSVVSFDYFSVPTDKTFLTKVFPRSKVLRTATIVPSIDGIWQLALFDEGANGQRTLYARGQDYEHMNLRENLVGLLDRADQELDCDQVVVALDKKDPNLASILHSLMYVGGLVIPPSATSIHRKHSSKVVLVGIKL